MKMLRFQQNKLKSFWKLGEFKKFKNEKICKDFENFLNNLRKYLEKYFT